MQDIIKESLEGSIIKIDEKLVTHHLNEIVLETVEQTFTFLISPAQLRFNTIPSR